LSSRSSAGRTIVKCPTAASRRSGR
jgi:hypothetical protein